ncbi:MAG: hypothetical protein QNJ77_01940 [Acidimicrobiia bacterium]|nr:hypothetical protein [Acidimicrobiia bacterium]
MILSAYLRSYLRYEGVTEYAEHVATDATVRTERAPTPVWGNDYFLWTEPTGDDAFSVVWQDATYVCPRYPRLRMLEGVLAFNSAFPDAGLIPQTELVTANDELSRLRSESPAARSHILTSPWHVPIRWFAAFLHEDKELYEAAAGISVRYRTLMGDAQERVARATQIVAGAGFDPSIVGQVEGLESWLRRFPPDAMLELDYARVAELFSEGDLVLDDSAADAASSLLALELGNFEEAGTFYAKIARRWGRVQSVAFSN